MYRSAYTPILTNTQANYIRCQSYGILTAQQDRTDCTHLHERKETLLQYQYQINTSTDRHADAQTDQYCVVFISRTFHRMTAH